MPEPEQPWHADALDPEIVRGYYSELTRCEHCGVLDADTRRFQLEEHFIWLHDHCGAEFRPTYSQWVHTNKRIAGAIVTNDEGATFRAWKLIGSRLIDAGEHQSAGRAEYAALSRQIMPPAAPGWFRSRRQKGKSP